jgi:hypothetical protein
VDKADAAETLVYCALHNFCELRRLPLPPSISTKGNRDILCGFDNPVPHSVDGRAAKDARIAMKDILFA